MNKTGAYNAYGTIYALVSSIPPGRVATYGQIAAMAGIPRGHRLAALAISRTPPGLDLPCHRVVSASGGMAPPHVFGGEGCQRNLLEAEGVVFLENGRVDMDSFLWREDTE